MAQKTHSAATASGLVPAENGEPATCLAFDPSPRSPREALPENACDCHFHVYADPSEFPLSPQRSYTPAPASWESYLAMTEKLGLKRAVLVHPSPYGADHSSFESILRKDPVNLRGVAVAFAETPDQDIERWHELGARGTRFNLISGGGPLIETMPVVADKVREYNWHLQLMIDVNRFPKALAKAARLKLPLVIDHTGHTDAATALSGQGWDDLTGRVRDGTAWVKLSGAYRISADRKTYVDVRPMWDALIEANPAQLVWGTDWPHPDISSPMPNDADLANLLLDWLTPELRQQILVDNPGRLYWADRAD